MTEILNSLFIVLTNQKEVINKKAPPHCVDSVSSLDPHWRPSSSFCRPCQVDFHYVLKFETLREEEEAFKALMQFEAYLPDQHRNVNKAKDLSDKELVEVYFEQLSTEDVEGLFRVYEEDFRMFGYAFHYRNMTWP